MRIAGAVGLAVLALFFWAASYAMTGAQPRETPDMECYERMPPGWDESSDAAWRMGHLPPRLHCTMSNGRTGEVVTWNSGQASLPAFVATGLALVASVVLFVSDVRSRYQLGLSPRARACRRRAGRRARRARTPRPLRRRNRWRSPS